MEQGQELNSSGISELLPCADDRCHNGGSCYIDEQLIFGCICPPGYSGKFCDVEELRNQDSIGPEKTQL
uniref:EGF-like domain-containing protein n=1 Tax=Steinernema glaseri TaxID=37863 RepID=A0A1I8A708_9BILA